MSGENLFSEVIRFIISTLMTELSWFYLCITGSGVMECNSRLSIHGKTGGQCALCRDREHCNALLISGLDSQISSLIPGCHSQQSGQNNHSRRGEILAWNECVEAERWFHLDIDIDNLRSSQLWLHTCLAHSVTVTLTASLLLVWGWLNWTERQSVSDGWSLLHLDTGRFSCNFGWVHSSLVTGRIISRKKYLDIITYNYYCYYIMFCPT